MELKDNSKLGESFNGFGCLVASFISLMKDDVGDIYIEPESSFGEDGENYLYTVQEQLDGFSESIWMKLTRFMPLYV
jgi:hypothetical protein